MVRNENAAEIIFCKSVDYAVWET